MGEGKIGPSPNRACGNDCDALSRKPAGEGTTARSAISARFYDSLAKFGCSEGRIARGSAQRVPKPDSAFILPHLVRIDRPSGVHGGRGTKNDAAFGL